MGVKGKMWRVIKTMYNSSRSAVLLESEKSSTFSVEQGVPQGCSLSPILFSVFISDLLEEIDRAQIGIQLKNGNKVGVSYRGGGALEFPPPQPHFPPPRNLEI